MYKIDKGIPMSKSQIRGESGYKVLRRMEIGDSVFLKGDSVNRVASRFYVPALRLKYKIVTRRVEGGVRMWRVE